MTPGPLGDAIVLMSLAFVILVIAWASTRLVAGDRAQFLPLVVGTLILPIMLSGASLVAYPGTQSLSSADIQFIRAIDHILAGLPLTGEARLTLYPTSFAGFAALARLTGLDATELLNWSWLLSMPLVIVGFGLFARTLTKSSVIGVLAMVVLVTDPWHIVLPIYDGYNLVLLPFWAYQLLLVLRHHSSGHVIGFALLTAAVVTSHLFTSLFAILAALALTLSRELVEERKPRGSGPGIGSAMNTAMRTMAIPVVSISAWLVYVAERYLREGAALVHAFIAAFGRSAAPPTLVGLGLLSWPQQVILIIAVLVDAAIGAAAVIWGLRSRRSRVLSAAVVALTVIPLMVWAIATPPEFSHGTDLKEWKVRPLFGAFLLVAPLLALGIWAVGRWGRVQWTSSVAIGLAIGLLLVNAQTLSLSYGTLGIRTYYSEQEPSVVEDPALPSEQYAALGTYVRTVLSPNTQIVANWRQSSWMTGVGGLQTIPHYQSLALSDRRVLRSQLDSPSVRGIAVDRMLLELPSVYTDRRASGLVTQSLESEPMNRVFDSGDQLLYLKAAPRGG